MPIRSFPDSGVLIDAARGVPPTATIALGYLNNSSHVRRFLTSAFVRLETIPKAHHARRVGELALYHSFFNNPHLEWCRDWAALEALADEVALRHGLGALDALHLAAAHLLGADELMTTERPTKPLYRNTLVEVVYLYDGLL